jgi:competence protein ComEC
MHSALGSPSLFLTAIDVGQGDAVALKTGQTGAGADLGPDGHASQRSDLGVTLIDAGPPGTPWDSLVPAHALHHIENLILTHPDADHIGGVLTLMQNAGVENLYIASWQAFRAAPMGQAVLESARQGGVRVDTLRAGQVLPGTSGTLKVLWPPPDTTILGNNGSLVLQWIDSSGEAAALFMGDAGIEVEAALMGRQVSLQAPLLKVGHHGSRTASRAGFLFEVRPQVAVISCDSGVFGHPHPEVTEALNLAIPEGLIWRTDRQGTLNLSWQVETGWSSAP